MPISKVVNTVIMNADIVNEIICINYNNLTLYNLGYPPVFEPPLNQPKIKKDYFIFYK